MTDYKVGGARDLSIDMESSWDAGKARSAIWDWAGWDGNTAPNKSGGKTRQAFVLYDADAPDQKGSYKLPFAMPSSGSLKAVANGVRNAKSRLDAVDGVSSETKTAAGSFLDDYMGKIQKKMQDADSRQIWVAGARIVRVDQAELLAIAKQRHAFDDSIFDESPPFFWRTIPSNQQMDAYGTRMMDDTLQNFASEADDGVAFLASHDTDYLPFGRSITGKYFDGRSQAGKRVEADFYTIPGLETGKITSDAFIRGVRSGILHDVSVGFYGGEIRCSVCDAQMIAFFGRLYARCDHLPGLMYYKKNKDGSDSDTKVMATGDIHGAHLAEVSSVYDGATPGAAVIGIARAMGLADQGMLEPEQRARLESQYRIRLPGSGHVWPGSSFDDGDGREPPAVPDPPGGSTMGDRETAEAQAALETAEARGHQRAMDEVRTLLQDAGLAPRERWDRDVPRVVREVGSELTRLRPLAADGERYKADLVKDALKEGVRALGDGFSESIYRPMLERSDVDTIIRMRDDWKATADKILKAGRATNDDAGHGADQNSQFRPPRAVHAG